MLSKYTGEQKLSVESTAEGRSSQQITEVREKDETMKYPCPYQR